MLNIVISSVLLFLFQLREKGIMYYNVVCVLPRKILSVYGYGFHTDKSFPSKHNFCRDHKLSYHSRNVVQSVVTNNL